MKRRLENLEVERWVLGIADRVKNGQSVEDSREELKREWPSDHAKAAKQIAGMANAAKGEQILWVIGIDEKAGAVGAIPEELSNWWSQVQKHFDDIAPSLRDLNVPVEGHTVIALLFDTDRFSVRCTRA